MLQARHLPVMHIHTHPVALTTICPVINLNDILCNIDCLYWKLCVCVYVFAPPAYDFISPGSDPNGSVLHAWHFVSVFIAEM